MEWGRGTEEDTYNKYGDDAGKVEIGAPAKHGTFVRAGISEMPPCGSVIEGRFVYAQKTKPLTSGYAKTGTCVGDMVRLDPRFS